MADQRGDSTPLHDGTDEPRTTTPGELLVELRTKLTEIHGMLSDQWGHAEAPYEPVALSAIAGLAEALDWWETLPQPQPPDPRCRYTFPLPRWMGPDQDDPCRCDLPAGHDGGHSCAHLRRENAEIVFAIDNDGDPS
jgi:hypothetical protein